MNKEISVTPCYLYKAHIGKIFMNLAHACPYRRKLLVK
jgi:hypothetical protein